MLAFSPQAPAFKPLKESNVMAKALTCRSLPVTPRMETARQAVDAWFGPRAVIPVSSHAAWVLRYGRYAQPAETRL